MIKSLYIKNFAIVDELEIEFGKGFNILTGETGAGKSILIDAIDIAFGARASKEFIKAGQNKAVIELQIDSGSTFPSEILEENGIESDNQLLTVSREISQSGTKARINGSIVTQSFVQTVRKLLIDIHTQHETYNYINPKTHIQLLDSYGDEIHKNLLNEYKEKYFELKKIQKTLDNLQNQTANNEQRVDFLKYQIDEIRSAEIKDASEYEQLEEELNILSNSEELQELTSSSYECLYDSENSVIDILNSIENKLSKASDYDKALGEIAELISSSTINLREASSLLRSHSDKLDTDPQRLNEVEERIYILDKLRKKYGPTLQDVVVCLEKFEKELSEIDTSDERISELKKQLTTLNKLTLESAQKITSSREKLAKDLSDKIIAELKKLEMPNAIFKINIEKLDTLTDKGYDNIEFLISTNAGEEAKSLSKVASGGEISRVMLAIKTIFAKADSVNTVIFDEIDTGISGKTSQAVGEAMISLSESHQILCITHQPIIAAMADDYLFIEKIQGKDRTTVSVKKLTEQEKIRAISKLASGSVEDKESVKFAEKLVNQARDFKLQNCLS